MFVRPHSLETRGALMLELLFKAAHVVVLAGWSALFFAPAKPSALIGTARSIAALLAVTYSLLFLATAPQASVLATNYSLDGVGAFFAHPALRLVGWVHYLAFDLWVGTWEAEEANRIRLPHGLLLLSLVLTFLLGPVGLLTFLLIRAIRRPS
jgi:hypothetical protein